MAIRDRLRAVWSAAFGSGAGGLWTAPWHLRRDGPAPITVNAQTALALTAVYRACSLLSDAASSAPAVLYSRPQSGGRVIDTTSAAARALATLAHQDAELFAFSVALVGNGFLKIERDGTGAPFALCAVPPWRVVLEIEDRTRAVWYRILPDPMLGEPEVLLPEADVIHARYRVTSNRLIGVPPMASCAPSFALALQSREVQRALFSNLATPGGVITAPGKMDQDVARRLQAEWQQNFSSEGRGVGKVAVLTNGLQYEPIIFKAADAQLLEQVNASTQDIARAYSIPRQFLEDAVTMTYASASEGTRALYALALRGFCVRLADAIGQKLLSRNDRAAGAGVEFDLSDMLIMPGAEMSTFLGALVSQGLVTPNEARNGWLRLPDLPGGDTLRVPTNTQGANQTLAGARAWEPGQRYTRGALACKDGGLWRAATDTADEPRHDSANWDALVWGASVSEDLQ